MKKKLVIITNTEGGALRQDVYDSDIEAIRRTQPNHSLVIEFDKAKVGDEIHIGGDGYENDFIFCVSAYPPKKLY